MRPDKLATLETYGSISDDGIVLSLTDDSGDYACSNFIGADKVKNIGDLYKVVYHKVLLECCLVEVDRLPLGEV